MAANKGLLVSTRTSEFQSWFTSLAKSPNLHGNPLSQVARDYLTYRLTEGANLQSYKKMNTWVEALGARPIRGITTQDLTAVIQKQHWAASTRNGAVAVISGLFRWAKVEPNPARDLPRARFDNARQRHLTLQEVDRVIHHCPEWLRDAVQFSVMTGWRQADTLDLRVQCFQKQSEGHGLLTTHNPTKNGKRLTVPVAGSLFYLLERRATGRPEDARMFPGPRGGHALGAIRDAFPKAVRDSGLPYGSGVWDVSWHTLRHSFATLMSEGGVEAQTIQEMGGWRTRSMVERYTHSTEVRLKRAASGLDGVFRG